MTHTTGGAERVLRCPSVFVWSVARDLAERSPSAHWENRNTLLRDFGAPRDTAPDPTVRMIAAYNRVMRERGGLWKANECPFFTTLARLVGLPLEALRFDPIKRRAHAVPRAVNGTGRYGTAAGAAHEVLVTRFEDTADLPAIVRDVVPEFEIVNGPSPATREAAGNRNPHVRAFRERAAALVAAKYSHRFAACDTTRFYPNATVPQLSGATAGQTARIAKLRQQRESIDAELASLESGNL